MAQKMEKRDRIEGGIMVLPRTRTSRVPSGSKMLSACLHNSEIAIVFDQKKE
jgi:hypothetical protein